MSKKKVNRNLLALFTQHCISSMTTLSLAHQHASTDRKKRDNEDKGKEK